MEFGKLSDIDHIDWSLPPVDKKSAGFLASINSTTSEFYLGTPTWGSKTWLGKIYPHDAKSTEFLHYYSRAFNTIELNTTHYRLPSSEIVKGWCEQVPANFRFCPKFPQTISHERNGILDQELLKHWQRALADFSNNLGVSFLQLPPYFSYADRAVLHRFLEAWPSEFPLALEFRHPSWFVHGHVLPALVDYLQNKQIGLVITDVAGRRDVLHSSISSPFVLLRFIGNDLHESDFTRSALWLERIKLWRAQGLKEFYFFAHEPDDIFCPELTEHLVSTYAPELKIDLPSPLWQSQTTQTSLL